MSTMDELLKALREFRKEKHWKTGLERMPDLVQRVLELEDEIAELKAKLERQSRLGFGQGAQLLATVGVFERLLAFLAWSKEDSSVSADE